MDRAEGQFEGASFAFYWTSTSVLVSSRHRQLCEAGPHTPAWLVPWLCPETLWASCGPVALSLFVE